MLTQGEIEDAIMQVVERLESLTDEYAAICDLSADAEATYRVRFYRSLLAIKADESRKQTDKAAEAQATVMVENELRAHKMLAGQVDSMKQALLTHRTRLDALRTLSANVRSQT